MRDVRFGAETRWRNEVLDIDRDEILDLVRRDPLVARAALEVVHPGESARIVTIQDIIEPRVKAAGKGVASARLAPHRVVGTVGDSSVGRHSTAPKRVRPRKLYDSVTVCTDWCRSPNPGTSASRAEIRYPTLRA